MLKLKNPRITRKRGGIFYFLKEHFLGEIIFLIAVGLVSGLIFFMARPTKTPKSVPIAITPETIVLAQKSDIFDHLTIEAKSAIVVDAQSGDILYQKDADRVVPLASITKVITALTALDMIPSYTTIRIDPTFLAAEGDSGLFSDERWTLKNLLDFSLVTSSNDGALAIASVAGAIANGTGLYAVGRDDFITAMNKKAHDLGLTHTHFWNASGLDLDTAQSGGYGSARDIASLFGHVLKNDLGLLEATTRSRITVSSTTKTHTGANTDTIVDLIPGMLASKTGYTDLAGGNLAIAFNAGLNHPIIIIVLGSTYDGRFDDVQTLADTTINYFSSQSDSSSLAQETSNEHHDN